MEGEKFILLTKDNPNKTKTDTHTQYKQTHMSTNIIQDKMKQLKHESKTLEEGNRVSPPGAEEDQNENYSQASQLDDEDRM